MKTYEKNSGKLDLFKLISNIFSRNRKDTIELINTYHVKLLFDNFDPANHTIAKKISDFLDSYKKCSYTLTSDQTAVRSHEKLDFGFNHYEKLHIQDISRTEIRSLVRKMIDKPEDYVDALVQKMVNVFKQYQMPFNFWTVSVFLYILIERRLSRLNIQNNSELIDLYIQEILGREQLAQGSRFSFDKYKTYLSFLAVKLFKKHANTTYSAPYSTIIKYTEKFTSKSGRNTLPAKDIVDYVLEKGILKSVEADRFAFRLPGVFEYFLANEFLNNRKFLNKVISDDQLFVQFRNELDLYSGFEKNPKRQKSFLKKVFKKVQAEFDNLNEKYFGQQNIDSCLVNITGKSTIIDFIGQLNVGNVETPSYDERDIIETELEEELRDTEGLNLHGEIRLKKQFDKDADKHEFLERHLFILSRTYRNIDADFDIDFDKTVLSYILESTCSLGFLLIEEIFQEDESENSYNSYFLPKEFLKMANSILPMMVQKFFHDSVGHINLENIILGLIEEYQKDEANNQFKLFILYFTLMDLELKNIDKYLDKIFELTNIGILKSSILCKIVFYLIYRAQGKKSLISTLKTKFRDFQIAYNPKLDRDALNKRLNDLDKTRLIMNKIQASN